MMSLSWVQRPNVYWCVCMFVGLWCVLSLCGSTLVQAHKDTFTYNPDQDSLDDQDTDGSWPGTTIRARRRSQKSKTPKKKTFAGSFQLGAGYHMQRGFGANVALSGKHLFGVDGLQLDLQAGLDAYQFKAATALRYDPSDRPFFLETNLEAMSRRFSLIDGPNPRELSFLSRSRVGWKWGEGWRLSVGALVGSIQLSDGSLLARDGLFDPTPWQDDRARLRLAGELRLSYRKPFEKASQYPFATGLQLDLVAEAGALVIGDTTQPYAKADMKATLGIPLPFGIHLSAGVQGGVIAGLFLQLPLSMRYHLQGPFGASQWLQVAGPQVLFGDGQVSMGGMGMLRAHLELKVPLWKEVGLYAFVGAEAAALLHSAGTALQSPSTGTILVDASWGASAMAGLIWRSPIGPLRFGVSVPLVQQPGGSPVMFGVGLGF